MTGHADRAVARAAARLVRGWEQEPVSGSHRDMTAHQDAADDRERSLADAVNANNEEQSR